MFVYSNYELIVNLLPPSLRRRRLVRMLLALLGPFDTNIGVIWRVRNDTLLELQNTPQVVSMTRLLNRQFDPGQKRISIADGDYNDVVMLYRGFCFTELFRQQPVFVPRAVSFNNNTYVLNRAIVLPRLSNAGTEGYDFIVRVPASLNIDTARLEAVVNRYKLPSTQFLIKRV